MSHPWPLLYGHGTSWQTISVVDKGWDIWSVSPAGPNAPNKNRPCKISRHMPHGHIVPQCFLLLIYRRRSRAMPRGPWPLLFYKVKKLTLFVRKCVIPLFQHNSPFWGSFFKVHGIIHPAIKNNNTNWVFKDYATWCENSSSCISNMKFLFSEILCFFVGGGGGHNNSGDKTVPPSMGKSCAAWRWVHVTVLGPFVGSIV